MYFMMPESKVINHDVLAQEWFDIYIILYLYYFERSFGHGFLKQEPAVPSGRYFSRRTVRADRDRIYNGLGYPSSDQLCAR